MKPLLILVFAFTISSGCDRKAEQEFDLLYEASAQERNPAWQPDAALTSWQDQIAEYLLVEVIQSKNGIGGIKTHVLTGEVSNDLFASLEKRFAKSGFYCCMDSITYKRGQAQTL